jgi:glycosyl transferase family 25
LISTAVLLSIGAAGPRIGCVERAMIATAYVINLAASTKRWHDMQPILSAMRLADCRRFDAINGAALDAAELAALAAQSHLLPDSEGFDARCRWGEIGCALSHRGVLADIVRRQLPSALILEDDIALDGAASAWPGRFRSAFADLPNDWELWYLYRCFDIEHRVVRLSPRTIVPWTPQGGAAYAVTLTGARKLLAALTPVTSAVDRIYAPLVQRRAIAAYAASPMLIQPGEHPSVINRDNPAKKWVENGVNRPPEYWPPAQLAHLGEAVPADLASPEMPRSFWQRLVRTARRLAGLS